MELWLPCAGRLSWHRNSLLLTAALCAVGAGAGGGCCCAVMEMCVQD